MSVLKVDLFAFHVFSLGYSCQASVQQSASFSPPDCLSLQHFQMENSTLEQCGAVRALVEPAVLRPRSGSTNKCFAAAYKVAWLVWWNRCFHCSSVKYTHFDTAENPPHPRVKTFCFFSWKIFCDSISYNLMVGGNTANVPNSVCHSGLPSGRHCSHILCYISGTPCFRKHAEQIFQFCVIPLWCICHPRVSCQQPAVWLLFSCTSLTTADQSNNLLLAQYLLCIVAEFPGRLCWIIISFFLRGFCTALCNKGSSP